MKYDGVDDDGEFDIRQYPAKYIGQETEYREFGDAVRIIKRREGPLGAD